LGCAQTESGISPNNQTALAHAARTHLAHRAAIAMSCYPNLIKGKAYKTLIPNG